MWPWLVPGVLLLAAMTVWGALRYPDLPDRVPLHIGPDGVDAWTQRSVATAFVPVLVYAGVTVLTAAAALLTTRLTPLEELPGSDGARSGTAQMLTNRPASAASARRTARALLQMNALFGVAFVPLCHLQWRTAEVAAVPAWTLPTTLAVFALAFVPLGAAWKQENAEKRALARRRKTAAKQG